MNIIAVLILGALGGILRLSFETFGVYGTLSLNLVGSLALGLFQGLLAKKDVPPWIHNGVGVGLIGSLTTFSAFTSDTDILVSISLWAAALYVVLSVTGGMVCCVAGERLAKTVLQIQSNEDQQDSGEQSRTFAKFPRYKPKTKSSGD